ncbi:FtsX-like permease family protein [Allorhizocola rhizosphaerae]|uniref:FtsX-like permease family protein n=1 Tax=Allorhizocola rhizosphaerae TaxID=1872709 RepID=UPI0013C2B8CF|nr:FtsX-like permease family protein [Allorhizocola rhizosphaerae]
MIAMMLALLRARMSLAVMTFVLTALAAGAAATGPLYATAAARSALVAEVEAASISERVIAGDLLSRSRGFDRQNALETQPYVPGFRTVAGAMSNGKLRSPNGSASLWLASRTGVCGEIVVSQGRCATADREVVLRRDIGQTIGAAIGSEVQFMPSSFGGGELLAPVRLTVVGHYEPYVPTDIYWADHIMLASGDSPPAFANERTVLAATGPMLFTTDLIASPQAFDDRERLAGDVANVLAVFEAAGYDSATEIAALSARIDDAADVLLGSLIVATLPLVIICWYVLFLAVVGAVEQRRGELAVTALRGVPTRMRWQLAAAETTVPILLGLGPGLVLGFLVTATLSATFTWLAVALAGVAVLGALAAGWFAQWRAMRLPVVQLLQRIRRRRGGSAPARAGEAAIGVLALATGYQAATAGGGGGIALLAPICFGLGCGLLAGRLALRPTEHIGRWFVGRGWLTAGLGALAIARRPGSRAIVALLTVGLGMLGFALTAADTAQQAWAMRARVETGAPQVLTVLPVSGARLLDGVRTVDPDGRFAMGVARVQLANMPPVLAVDSTRVSTVAYWPGFAERAESLLRPQEPDVLRMRGERLDMAVNVQEMAPGTTARIELNLVKANGDRTAVITDELRVGSGWYQMKTLGCEERPCRLAGMTVNVSGPQRIRLTLGEIRNEAGEVVLDRAAMGDVKRWLQSVASAANPIGELESTPEGLGVRADSGVPVDLHLRPRSAPGPMPAVAAGDLPRQLTVVGGSVPLVLAEGADLLPRLGNKGLLLDLEYADLAMNLRAELLMPEVWLSADAPADVTERLLAAGVVVQGRVTTDDRHEMFSRQAPALALRFQRLAAVAAMMLAALGLIVAAMLDRTRSGLDLSVMVPHGLSKTSVRIGALLGRWALIVIAAFAGAVAALAAWLVARPVIPVYTVDVPTIPLPQWPGPPVAWFAVAALAFLLSTGWVAAQFSRGTVEGANS